MFSVFSELALITDTHNYSAHRDTVTVDGFTAIFILTPSFCFKRAEIRLPSTAKHYDYLKDRQGQPPFVSMNKMTST
jgi:hypothetical protein